MKKGIFYIVIAFTLALLVISGCAHKTVKTVSPSPDEMVGAVPAQDQEDSSSRANPTEVEETGTGDVFSEFEEEFEDQSLKVADPLAPLNRAVFHFNDKLYFWVLKPLAQGYNFVLPDFARKGVRNFFSNLLTPIRLTNCILQGKGVAAGTEFARFVTNTFIGILGVWDPALDLYGLEMSDEDLGQTLGAYGIGNGFYIVWPFFGPSSMRDSVGWLGDTYVNPITYLDSTGAIIAIGLYRRFNDLTFRIGDYETIKKAAIDPYTAMRDGYIQYRNALIEE
jgi:phospholipid-binding lipoprotein MlaA